MYATSSFAPPGLTPAIWARTHGLRRGLHSSAAPRLPDKFDFLEERHRNAVTDITIAKRVVSKWDPQNASSDRGSSVEPGVHSSEGAKECSPRRKAWVTGGKNGPAPKGRKKRHTTAKRVVSNRPVERQLPPCFKCRGRRAQLRRSKRMQPTP